MARIWDPIILIDSCGYVACCHKVEDAGSIFKFYHNDIVRNIASRYLSIVKIDGREVFKITYKEDSNNG